MSYEICYSKAFIKTHRGIIPLLLSGSNNCYDWTGRRERSWTTYYGNKHIEKSASEILAFYAKKVDSAENYDFCDYRGKRLYFNDAYDFYEKGIKNALYLEDYLEKGQFRNTRGFAYKISYLKCYISDWSEGYDNHKKVLEREIKTTAELEAWLDDARAYVGDNNDKKYICISFNDNEAISVKKEVNIKGACVIKDKKWFLSSSDAKNWTCVKNVQDALIFENSEQAKKHLEAMREHWAYSVNRLKIVKYNTKTPIKNCYVRIEGHGVFARFSKYGYRYSYCICDEFKMTEQRAKQVVEKIHRLFGNDRKCEIVKEGA